MILTMDDGRTFDTVVDLTAAERHILQKLLFWSTAATDLREFQEKRKEAFIKGWDKSGPVSESRTMKAILHDLERKLIKRLGPSPPPGPN